MCDVDNLLGELENLSPICYKEKIWISCFETPKHKFTNYVFQKGVQVFVLPLRGKYDEKEALSVVQYVKKSEINSFSQFTVIKGLQHSKFDRLGLISPEGHDTFKFKVPALHRRTIVVFPFFKYEFSGNEDYEVVRVMRKDFVSTLDWTRDLMPKILMRYNNTKTKSKSIGKKLGLAKKQTLFREIVNLSIPEASGSFVQIQNYQGALCEVTFNKSFRIVHEDTELLLGNEEILKSVWTWLTN